MILSRNALSNNINNTNILNMENKNETTRRTRTVTMRNRSRKNQQRQMIQQIVKIWVHVRSASGRNLSPIKEDDIQIPKQLPISTNMHGKDDNESMILKVPSNEMKINTDYSNSLQKNEIVIQVYQVVDISWYTTWRTTSTFTNKNIVHKYLPFIIH